MNKLLNLAAVPIILLLGSTYAVAAGAFEVEEASIETLQRAIKSGETTCKGIVQAYIARAKAYNGVCTSLVTADGAPVKPVKGYIRAGRRWCFPPRPSTPRACFRT